MSYSTMDSLLLCIIKVCQNVGLHFIIQFHDLFLRTENHSGLNSLLGNDSHLLFILFQTSSIGFNMPIKDGKRIGIYASQCSLY